MENACYNMPTNGGNPFPQRRYEKMKGRVLAIVTGVLNFLAIVLWVISFLFLIIVDRSLLSNTGSSGGTASEQFGEGLGKAFGLVFMIIAFVFLIPSVILAIISGIGQCALGGIKGKPSIGFAIPALLAHLWAVLVFIWNSWLSLDIGSNRFLPSLMYIIPGLVSLGVFVFTIVALALRKVVAPKKVTLTAELAEEAVEEILNEDIVQTEVAPTEESEE